jgi:adenylosuccinate synthase
MKRGFIILDLMFGDGGKGLTTKFLCNEYRQENPIVIRFSGGQQAGHTVIDDGIKHISSNYGSGVLNCVPTYLTEHCTVYPNTISRERESLYGKGINPILYVHPLANLTTPSDVAYNRVIELKQGHGSCGMGVGATMSRNLTTGFKIYAIDVLSPEIFTQKLRNISNYYRSKFTGDDLEEFIRIEKEQGETFYKVVHNIFEVENYGFLNNYETFIFEGSQGILLDMNHGIFPNVTYANTTSKNAIEVCKKLKIRDIAVFYVTRCYQTRHGEGWMSNEKELNLINNEEEINVPNTWQGYFRTGEVDYGLLNFSLSIDDTYLDRLGVRKNLVVTCLDQRPDFRFEYEKLPNFTEYYESYSPVSKKLKDSTLEVYCGKLGKQMNKQ